MSSEIAVYERPLTIEQVKADINLIQHVLRDVMQNGTHYGTIPGCGGDKPALFKPGAEKIMATFKLAASPRVDDLSTADIARYRVMCDGIAPNGRLVGTGVGEASSDEEKYKWKAAVCKAQFDETPEDRRRMKWYKDGTSVPQIRTVPADVANTVLKMAKKRALVDMVLTCTAASDIFTQDLEDEDEPGGPNGKPPIKTPQRKSAPPAEQPQSKNGPDSPPANCISDGQRKRFYAIAKGAGKADEQIKGYLAEVWNIEHTSAITKDIYEECCAWAQAN